MLNLCVNMVQVALCLSNRSVPAVGPKAQVMLCQVHLLTAGVPSWLFLWDHRDKKGK